jgi:hypothetical protein
MLDAVFSEISKLLSRNPADPSGSAQPQRFAIVRDCIDVIAEKAIARPILNEFSVTEYIQSAVLSSDPERAGPIGVEGAYLATAKTRGWRV